MMGTWTLERFAALVDDMRTKQSAYFRGRSRATGAGHIALLRAAREAEAAVDAALAEIAEYRPMSGRDAGLS